MNVIAGCVIIHQVTVKLFQQGEIVGSILQSQLEHFFSTLAVCTPYTIQGGGGNVSIYPGMLQNMVARILARLLASGWPSTHPHPGHVPHGECPCQAGIQKG